MEKLFEFLNKILQNLTHLPIELLMDNELDLKVIQIEKQLNLQTCLVDIFNLGSSQYEIFKNLFQSAFLITLNLVIDQRIVKKLFDNFENLTILLHNNNKYQTFTTLNQIYKGTFQETNSLTILLGIPQKLNSTTVKQLLEHYISVIEIFHSHIELVFGYQCIKEAEKIKLINSCPEMLWDMMSIFRVLNGRGNRISLQQLKEEAKVEQYSWGETILYINNQDSLAIYLMQNFLPINTSTICLSKLSAQQKYYTPIGLSISRRNRRSQSKEPSIAVINIRDLKQIDFVLECRKKLYTQFEKTAKFQKQFKSIDKAQKQCEKIANILKIEPFLVYKAFLP